MLITRLIRLLTATASAVTLLLMLCSCSSNAAADYSQEKSEQLLISLSQTKNIEQISKDTWHDLYAQCRAANSELDKQVKELLLTPWSDEKAQKINTLLRSQLYRQWRALSAHIQPLSMSGFQPSRWFTQKEINDLANEVKQTKLDIYNLKSQANIEDPFKDL